MSRQSEARIIAVRCLSGGFCLSLAVLTFGVQGLSGTGPAVDAFPVTGLRCCGTRRSGPGHHRRAPPAPGAEALASSAFTADALALVAYTRSTVETTSKDGVPGELNVASAGLKRPAEGFLMAPLESLSESSPFGLRTSPITGSAGEFHWGQDYAAACGTRVYSADAGVVRAVGWHPWGGGNRVEIDHGNGLITTYNHLEAIAVKKGDSVRVGEVIARVGTTGSSTGCHLHFETILNGSHKNPHDWTLLPITQTDQLGTIDMTSYAPDAGKPSNTSLGWAIPVSEDGTHVVAGGAHESPASAWPSTPNSASATPTPPTGDALSPTPTRWDTPTPEPSQPPSGSPGEPRHRGDPSRRVTLRPQATRRPRGPAPQRRHLQKRRRRRRRRSQPRRQCRRPRRSWNPRRRRRPLWNLCRRRRRPSWNLRRRRRRRRPPPPPDRRRRRRPSWNLRRRRHRPSWNPPPRAGAHVGTCTAAPTQSTAPSATTDPSLTPGP